jgi:uncharacterized protein YfaT (DUF1175 family)
MLVVCKSYEFGKQKFASDNSLRIFISRYLRNNPLVSNQQKAEMGLTVPDTMKSPTTESTPGVLGIEFQGNVAYATHLVHHNKIWIPGHENRANAKESKIHRYI